MKKNSSDVAATVYRIASNKTSSKITIEYLHSKEFKDFIYFDEDKLYLDIIQKFSI